MNDYKLRNQHSELLDPTQPLAVDTVEAQQVVSTSNTITYNGKAAAGAITINSTTYKAIVSVEGDQVASYWGLEKNKVYTALVDKRANQKKKPNWVTGLTETDAAADVTIYDPDFDLEAMFESVTTTVKRFVLKATDTSNNVLYGWIFGVAGASDVYTIDVVNNRVTETQNWYQGGSTAFDPTSVEKIEIFRYNSSLVFGTGTTLIEEVQCPREYSKAWFNPIKNAEADLSNGQYFVDYMRGRVIGKKADNTASETATYNIWSAIASGGTVVASNVNVSQIGGVATAIDDSGMAATPPFVPVGGEYRNAATTYSDGDATVLQSDVNGNLKVAISSDIEIGAVELKDGTTDARQAVKVDNATASATPTVALVGAHYKAALDTYADNDASPLHVNSKGCVYTQLHDGTTAAGVSATINGLKVDLVGEGGAAISATNPVITQLTDGSAVVSTSNPLSVNITDGTTPIAVKTAFTETYALATASLPTSGLCYGIDANNVGAPILAAMQVAVDNTTVSATPNVLMTGGVYKAALDTYDDNDAVPLHFDASGRLNVNTEVQGNAPQAHGIDAAGVDGYTTVVTAGAERHHIMIDLQGEYDAIISLDSGTTEHFYIPAGSSRVIDDIVIANSATVQGKNAGAGENYTNLSITIW